MYLSAFGEEGTGAFLEGHAASEGSSSYHYRRVDIGAGTCHAHPHYDGICCSELDC